MNVGPRSRLHRVNGGEFMTRPEFGADTITLATVFDVQPDRMDSQPGFGSLPVLCAVELTG